jgi:flagellar basal-body rod protein FlgF
VPYGIYISGEGAKAQADRLEVIANNVANADTVGFKADVPIFQARFAEAIQQGLAAAGDQSINDIGGGVKLAAVSTNFSEGQIKRTDNPLDMVIAGPGFFHVRGDDGQTLLTRAGNFALDATGRLVTLNEHRPVLDQDGSEIQLNPVDPWSVSPNGFILQGDSAFALAMSQPKSLDELTKIGQNLFRPRGSVEVVPLGERQVRQGFLEMSGASAVREMMAMIETTRAFEANTKLIQSQDSLIGALVSRVLKA